MCAQAKRNYNLNPTFWMTSTPSGFWITRTSGLEKNIYTCSRRSPHDKPPGRLELTTSPSGGRRGGKLKSARRSSPSSMKSSQYSSCWHLVECRNHGAHVTWGGVDGTKARQDNGRALQIAGEKKQMPVTVRTQMRCASRPHIPRKQQSVPCVMCEVTMYSRQQVVQYSLLCANAEVRTK